MTLTESSEIDSINVRASGHLEVRRADSILRGDKEISKTYHRHVLAPGDTLSGEDPRVVAIAKAAWTRDVVDAHARRMAAVLAETEERAKVAELSNAAEVKTDA